MRKNLVVNNETASVMNQVIGTLRATGLSRVEISTLVGILLYIKKQKAQLVDSFEYNQPLFELLDSDDDLYGEAEGVFIRAISKINIKFINQAMQMLCSTSYTEGEYLDWFDFCIEQTNSNKFAWEFFTPRSFCALAKAFISPKTKSIFVPYGGMMEFGTDMDNYEHIDAVEINHEIWLLGKIRLGLANKLDSVEFTNDSNTSWTNKQYDAIVSNPPLAMKIEMQDKYASANGNKRELAELVAANRFQETTTEDGTVVCFMGPSIQWANGEQKRFRMWAMEKHMIDAIILLPKGMLSYTSIPLACVILKKHPQQENAIRFIDASNMYDKTDGNILLDIEKVVAAYHIDQPKVSASISYDDIIENDYTWDLTQFLQHEELEIPEGHKAVVMEEIAQIPSCTKGTEADEGKLLRVTDLSNDWTKPYILPESISDSDNVKGCTKLEQTAIVVSLVRDLKPSIIKASKDAPVWLAKNVLAIIPKMDIDIEYLCMVLSKAKIGGTGIIPHISKNKIMKYKLALPEDISTQKTLYKEACQQEVMAKAKETGLLDVIDKMKTDYINEVRSRKHDMMPHLRQMSSARKNLEYYINHKDSMSDEDFVQEMKEEIANQKTAIDSLTTILKIFSRESQFGTPEIINIDKFLVENYPDGHNYQSEIEPDFQALANYGFTIPDSLLSINMNKGKNWQEYLKEVPDYAEGINVFMAKDDLQRLCDNIFGNAVKHGFTDPTRKDYSIWVQLTVDEERDMFQIDFTNNGTPFPKGLDKIRYGLRGEKGGITAGTGEGGYIVRSIVEHYGGDYDLLTQKDQNSIWSTVRIYLPIYRNDNEQ